MLHFQPFDLRKISVLLGLAAMMLVTPLQAAVHEKVLHRFKGSDGAYPSSNLVLDAAGHLYGTTSAGGNATACTGGCGVVFELTSSGGSWKETVLYAFQGTSDGTSPSGNLIADASGNLYGTTRYGGTGTACTNGCGVVFELSPNRDASWTESVLYDFTDGTAGAYPAGLVLGSSGKLYGVTTTGGGEFGSVFELSPPQHKGGKWKEKTLYGFSGLEVQANPGLIFDSQGALYGTWYQLYSCYPGCGAVFELEPGQNGWTETNLFEFTGGGNGGEPMAGIILDSQGHIYGTGAEGGNNWGIVFELKQSGGQWTESLPHNFCSLNDCADGSSPQAPLIFDPSGNLYGTAQGGGTGCAYPGCGVVFELTSTKNGWKETVLHNFKSGSDGSNPVEGLTLDGNGNIYGSTPLGGTGVGTIFEITR